MIEFSKDLIGNSWGKLDEKMDSISRKSHKEIESIRLNCPIQVLPEIVISRGSLFHEHSDQD